MKNGIVMELEKEKAVLMLTGGEFITVTAQPGWQVGGVVAYKDTTAKKVTLWKRAMLAAAACFAFLAMGIGGYNILYVPVSVISMDINPSVELSLNRLGGILETKAYNADGQKLLEKQKLEGENYKKALESLMGSDEMKPYLSQNSYLAFSVCSPKEAEITSYIEDLEKRLREQNPAMEVECYRVDDTVVQRAHSHGMTPGRWRALEQLQELDPTINIEDYKGCGIGEIHRHTQERRGQHREEEQNHHGGAAQNNGRPPADTSQSSSISEPAESQKGTSQGQNSAANQGGNSQRQNNNTDKTDAGQNGPAQGQTDRPNKPGDAPPGQNTPGRENTPGGPAWGDTEEEEDEEEESFSPPKGSGHGHNR